MKKLILFLALALVMCGCETYQSRGPMATLERCAKHFAEWQKNKDLEDSIKSDNTMPNKFYEKGRADMREEMMKDAVDAIFIQDYAYKTPVLYGDLKYKMNIVSGQPIKLCQIKEVQQ